MMRPCGGLRQGPLTRLGILRCLGRESARAYRTSARHHTVYQGWSSYFCVPWSAKAGRKSDVPGVRRPAIPFLNQIEGTKIPVLTASRIGINVGRVSSTRQRVSAGLYLSGDLSRFASMTEHSALYHVVVSD